MKSFLSNIFALLLIVAAFLGLAYILPLWAGVGVIILLQVVIIILIGINGNKKE